MWFIITSDWLWIYTGNNFKAWCTACSFWCVHTDGHCHWALHDGRTLMTVNSPERQHYFVLCVGQTWFCCTPWGSLSDKLFLLYFASGWLAYTCLQVMSRNVSTMVLLQYAQLAQGTILSHYKGMLKPLNLMRILNDILQTVIILGLYYISSLTNQIQI